MQSIPDLHSALVSYQKARQRINNRRKSKGFWPLKSRGKGVSRGGRKGGGKGTKDEHLARISRAHFYIAVRGVGALESRVPEQARCSL